MKTLERFWQWYDTESPEWPRVSEMQSANLSATVTWAPVRS